MGAGFSGPFFSPSQGGGGKRGMGGLWRSTSTSSSVHYSITFGLTLFCLPGLRRTELGEKRLKMGDIGSGLGY